MSDDKEMVTRSTWDEFRNSKMLWFANRLLHVFGWAIVVDVDADGAVTGAYPARVRFRGFGNESEEKGFIGITEYMVENAEQLLQEAKDE